MHFNSYPLLYHLCINKNKNVLCINSLEQTFSGSLDNQISSDIIDSKSLYLEYSAKTIRL